ncbi:MAG: pilus assembly protein PilP [Candidatus Aquirickettsiella sp.]
MKVALKMIKPNLKRIDLWSISLKYRVIISTVFFIFITGYIFMLRPTIEKKDNVYLHLQRLKKELSSQLKISSEYTHYHEKVTSLKKIYYACSNDAIDKYTPNVIRGQLFPYSVHINKINILSIKEKNFLSYLQVESDLFSTNNNIIKFLSQIIKLKNFLVIKNFRWIFFKTRSKIQKNFIFSLKIYRPYLSKDSFNLNVVKIKKFATDSISKKKELIKYPLNKIKTLGFLSLDKDKNFGFVELPNKQIHKVGLGDYLGLEQGLIIGIYAEKILILNNNLDKIIKLSVKNRKLQC